VSTLVFDQLQVLSERRQRVRLDVMKDAGSAQNGLKFLICNEAFGHGWDVVHLSPQAVTERSARMHRGGGGAASHRELGQPLGAPHRDGKWSLQATAPPANTCQDRLVGPAPIGDSAKSR